jgi:hypothetical protein
MAGPGSSVRLMAAGRRAQWQGGGVLPPAAAAWGSGALQVRESPCHGQFGIW